MKRLAGVSWLFVLFAVPSFCQLSIPSGASELRLALRKLNVLGTALYVGAHPDDENTAVIAALVNGRLVRTAYLSMTRGEGGQNLIGSEQGEALGILRTQELLSAREIDGGGQFFTRAIDFGYSKTSEETIRFWERNRIVSDIVWIIRSYRPDVIITRFTDALGTHGNHTSSAILTQEAFEAAGDPNKFPEQLKFVSPWKPRRLAFNVFRFGSSGADPTSKAVTMDAGEFSPLLGQSFTEISGRARSMHKSQGFGASENRGSSIQFFETTAGEPAVKDLFDGVNLSWSRIPGGESVRPFTEEAAQLFDPDHPERIIPALLKARRALSRTKGDQWIEIKRQEIENLILGCAGMWIEATSGEFSASPGTAIPVTVTVLNRSAPSVRLKAIRFPYATGDTLVGKSLGQNDPIRISSSIQVPMNAVPSQPYWLVRSHGEGSYEVADETHIAQPENAPITASVTLEIAGETMEIKTAVKYKWVDPVEGELHRPFIIVPPVTVNPLEKILVFAGNSQKELRLLLGGPGGPVRGSIRLEVPERWRVEPERQDFDIKEKGGEIAVSFRITALVGAKDGEFRAVAVSNGSSSSVGMVTIAYPHIPRQVYFPHATGKMVIIETKKPQGRIGYIMGSGDAIPAALEQLGYSVKLLSDADLESADLTEFGVIVAGVRAYNTRPKLKAQQARLLKYVENGGRYVVQYVTRQRNESENLGPYPFNVSRDRVTVEGAPMNFLKPDHQLLNTPNRILEEDFKGWIQERGLYFADEWDAHYETVLACNDPGESPKQGGLLFARYGKGTYIYTGYAFFRQLPAGVAGAYRLFVNLLHHQ